MHIEQLHCPSGKDWQPTEVRLGSEADLVFVFGETSRLKHPQLLGQIKESYPKAHLFGCSTAGEIYGDHVYNDSVTTTAIKFAGTKVEAASTQVLHCKSFDVGRELAFSLKHEGLTHVLVLSVGLNVNGSDLVEGLVHGLPRHVTLTGGLAGDQDRFKETLVVSDSSVSNDRVAVIGLYGPKVRVRSGSMGGWDSFGPERLVTKSSENILYELDNKPVLDLYKEYLGERAKDLPGSALLFPLSVTPSESNTSVVRTILGIDEESQSMIFAGDIPQGATVRLMKANLDRLIVGAVGAAKSTLPAKTKPPELALLISCVGRKLVLKERVDEEIEGIRTVFGPKTLFAGFYSYGEIAPSPSSEKCDLHNQTMTITTLSELEGDLPKTPPSSKTTGR